MVRWLRLIAAMVEVWKFSSPLPSLCENVLAVMVSTGSTLPAQPVASLAEGEGLHGPPR